MKHKLFLAVISVSSLLTACGHVSNAVLSEQDLLDKAEFATGISRDQLTLVERAGSLDAVDYRVATKKGRQFRCYFTSALAVTSDAVCQEITKDGKKTTKQKKDDCNALLRAAGKC